MSGGRVLLSAFDLELEVEPQLGGAITAFRSVRMGRKDLLRPAPERLEAMYDVACFPMAPFCNRIRDGRFTFRGRTVTLKPNVAGEPSPIHGQAWQAPWRVARQEDPAVELAYEHEAGEWPWAYEARQALNLFEGGLRAKLTLTNRSREAMPAGLGFHPYYPCAADTMLNAAVETVWTVDDRVLPLDEIPARGRYSLDQRRIDRAGLDNVYGGWSGEAQLSWPDRGLQLTLASSVRFLQVYSPAAGGMVVVEPVSHANDALSHPESEWPRLGMAVLEPDQAVEIEALFLIEDLAD